MTADVDATRPVRRSLLRRPSGSEWVALGSVAAIATSFVLPADHIEDGPVVCPFRLVTGLPCPGCGMTRSFVYLAHGRWGEAVASNAFGPVVYAAMVALVVAVVVARVRRAAPPSLETLAASRPLRAVVGLWLVFGVVRLVLTV